MSRTDHHRPWQIRAADHAEPNPHAYVLHRCGPGGDHARCGWTLPYMVLAGCPHWFVNHVWNGPERRRERDELRRLAQDFNAGRLDELDGDFANYQHRHCAQWLFS